MSNHNHSSVSHSLDAPLARECVEPPPLLPDRAAAADALPCSEEADAAAAPSRATRDRSALPVRYSIAMQEIPTDERPRERLQRHGPSAVSVSELLAIQLRTGSREHSALGLASELLKQFGGLRGMAAASQEELSRTKGIGPVKAIEIVAAIELGRRLSVLSAEEKPCIRSPQDVSNLLMAEMRDLKKEQMRSLLLDTKNRVMKTCLVSIGILDSSLVHPREVFQEAIVASAAAIIVAHNHPSGDPTPSVADREVTRRLHEAGKIIGIELLDHVIIGDNRYISLKERGVF